MNAVVRKTPGFQTVVTGDLSLLPVPHPDCCHHLHHAFSVASKDIVENKFFVNITDCQHAFFGHLKSSAGEVAVSVCGAEPFLSLLT